MALNFNPPQDLINAYINRPQPGEIASQGIQEALKTYVAGKQQQEQRAFQQKVLDSQDAERKAKEFGAIAPYIPEDQIPSYAKSMGLNIPQTQTSTPAQSPDANFSSITGDQQNVTPQGSPIIAHFNSLSQQPGGAGTAAGGGGAPPPMGPRPTSKYGLEKYQKNLQMTKTEGEMAPKMPITKEALLASGKPLDPMTQMIVEPPAPKDPGGEKLSDKQLADAQKAYNSDKNREKAEAVIQKVSQAVPLLKAGQIDNATAKQALQTAMTYMATGGMRVNELELRQFGGAKAVTNRMNQWYLDLDKGTLTARDAKDMASVLDIFQSAAHKGLQESGLRHTRQYLQRSRSGEKEPDAYKRVTGMDFVPDATGGATGPNGPSVTQNGHKYNWNAQTKQYE